MSRKTNNLRRRLRITSERAASIERDRRNAVTKIDKFVRQMREEDKTFAKAVMISVSKDVRHHETYGVTLQFCPRAYLYHGLNSSPDQMVALDHLAYDIGHRIGDMVTRAILEQKSKMGLGI